MNILVLCTGNSARSILLECVLHRLGGGAITSFSAGSHPAGKVHPQSLRLLAAEGYNIHGLRSKSWNEFTATGAPEMDAVITVCGSAASEVCPIWPGVPLRAHWGVEDPAAATPQDAPAAFRTAYEILSNRAEAFVKGLGNSMTAADLQAHLTASGTLS